MFSLMDDNYDDRSSVTIGHYTNWPMTALSNYPYAQRLRIDDDSEYAKLQRAIIRNKAQLRLRNKIFNRFRDPATVSSMRLRHRPVPVFRQRVPAAGFIRREAFQWKRKQTKRHAHS